MQWRIEGGRAGALAIFPSLISFLPKITRGMGIPALLDLPLICSLNFD